jgi:hypothetical protein
MGFSQYVSWVAGSTTMSQLILPVDLGSQDGGNLLES